MSKMKKFPDSVLIILIILMVFIGLTWLVPAGEFERVVKDGREVISPGTYQPVAQRGQSVWAMFTAPIRGFISAAQIIGFVFLIGGAFAILQRTGSIEAGLQRIIRYSLRHPQHKNWIVPLVIAFFSLAGATFGMSEETLVFVLITIPLALALGYDSITGVAISFVGAGVGFAGAFLNPFTIGIAQGIAELPPGSGMGYRLVVWLIFTLAGIWFIMRYARKVEKDPTLSPMHELDQNRPESHAAEKQLPLTRSRIATFFAFLACLILLVIGVSQWDWYINEISGLFIALGVLAAIICKMSANATLVAFMHGAKEMMTAALVIGLAKSLIVVAEDGAIIDTMLHGIASALDGVPKAVSAELMFVLQTGLNLFVPSGSGQAALTMPIMAPLSDLLEINRQSAVLAFQLGDGISNLVIPTSGVTMGVLAIAKIPYNVWFKWIMPMVILLSILALLVILPPVMGWTNW